MRWLVPFLLLLACTSAAHPADSLLAEAGKPGLRSEHRVRIWHSLLRDRSVPAAALLDDPQARRVLADTAAGDGWSWLLLADLHIQRSAFAPAIAASQRAMGIFKASGDEVALAMATMDLASVRSLSGDQHASMRAYFDALSILQRTGPAEEEAQALLGLAFIFRYQEDLDKALEMYRKAGEVGRSVNDPMLMVDAMRGEAGILLERERLDSAAVLYEQALALSTRSGNQRRMMVIHVELANIRIKLNDLDGAHDLLHDALTAFEEARNATWTSYTLARLSEVAHKQGDNAAALAYGQRGLALAKEKGLMKESLDNLFILPEVCAALGRYTEALDHSLAFETLHDSMRNDATATEMARLEMQQEQVRDSLLRVEKHGRERVVFEASVTRTRTRRNIFLFLGLAALALAGGLWSRLRHSRRLGLELAAGNALIEQEVARAERSEKVKEQFLANMSHEIRTPMNAIIGLTAMLRRGERLPGQDRYLDAIAQSSSNLLVILNDVLDLGKLEAGKVELERVAMDPRTVLGNVLDILRFKAEEKGLKLELRCSPEVPSHVIGDPTRLNQIMLNLVGNAIKFTEKGGVTIAVSVLFNEHNGVAEAGMDPITLRFSVRDTGIGIRQERINEIFEEFTQAYSDTTRKFGGTGLGLTITKRLIELQGGTVSVESTPEQGSTFTVEIPYAKVVGIAAVDGREAAAPVISLEGKRILLVEDNEFNVMVAQDELQDAIPGVHIDVASNGRIAVEKASTGTYDAILMDIQMPEMNGFEATGAIRALPGDRGRVPIVAMTANVLKSEVDRCMAVGMNAFVPKPFERKDLLEKLASAIMNGPRGS
ncbi:MAG: response regulator [Flavobacteriales bacterium]|nr:response regulator [Flavobacteriales bacterium]